MRSFTGTITIRWKSAMLFIDSTRRRTLSVSSSGKTYDAMSGNISLRAIRSIVAGISASV